MQILEPPPFSDQDAEADYYEDLCERGTEGEKLAAREKLAQLLYKRAMERQHQTNPKAVLPPANAEELLRAASLLERNVLDGYEDARQLGFLCHIYRAQGRYRLAKELSGVSDGLKAGTH